MIRASRGVVPGALIELHHQKYAIVARVMWHDGARAGLMSEDRVPVDDIMISGQAPLPATPGRVDDRRRGARDDLSWFQGRCVEFTGVLAIAATLTIGLATTVQSALGRPLAVVSAALDRN